MVALLLFACATGAAVPDATGTGAAPDTADTADSAAPDTADTADSADTGPDPSTQDNDLDGFTPAEGDCDDTLPHVYPGAPDACDGLDQDCDGEPIPDHSCGVTWDVSTMWSWEIEWGAVAVHTTHPGDVDGDGLADMAIYGDTNDGVVFVVDGPSGSWPVSAELPDPTWTDESPSWGMASVLPIIDSTGDDLGDTWILTEWRGSGPEGGLFLFPGQPGGVPAATTRIDDGAAAYWLDGDGARLGVEGDDPRAGVGDLTGDGLADVMLFDVSTTGVSQLTYIAGSVTPSGIHTFGSLPQMFVDQPDPSGVSAYLPGDLDGDGLADAEFGLLNLENRPLTFLSGADWADGGHLSDLGSNVYAGVNEDFGYLVQPALTEAPAGDVDGDGLVDALVGGRDAEGTVCLRLLTGGIPVDDVERWTYVRVCGTTAHSWVADSDGDGCADPTTANGAVVASSALQGGGTFNVSDLHLIMPESPDYNLETSADLDGDGKPEWVLEDFDLRRQLIVHGFEIPWDDPEKW